MHQPNWTKRKLFTYSVLVLALIFFMTELVFRLAARSHLKKHQTSVFVQGNTLQMDDSILIFRNRPYYLDYDHRFQNNEEGMRWQPADVRMPKKDSADFWVFLFGGSAMEGMGSNKDGEWLDITGVVDYAWNENIAFYVQQLLQEKMPHKRVRVFNAANTSYTIEQSYQRYLLLAEKYKMDWVISMDGQNNPPTLLPTETVMEYMRNDWQQHASKKFPLNTLIFLTRHSAFINSVKQSYFHIKQNRRLKTNATDSFPRRKFWADQSTPALVFKQPDAGVSRSVNLFYDQLRRFDSVLNVRQQKHLLLIQPHLIFRDTTQMDVTEKAVLNYYRQVHNNETVNSFLKHLRQQFQPMGNDVRLVNAADSARFPVFVDYCHFTKPGNKMIAGLICNHILSQEH